MSDKRVKKAIVIGLDGLIKPWAERLMAAGRMPNLAALLKGGTYAEEYFVAVPTLTPPNWTSLATGAWVGTHGIGQFRVHHAGDPLSRTTNGFSTESCRAEYMWEAAARAGRKSILVKYPCSLPPRGADVVVDGCHISECLHVLDIAHLFSTDPSNSIPRVEPRPAKGWNHLPSGGPPPLEVELGFESISERTVTESRRLVDTLGPDRPVLFALMTGRDDHYDQVLITRDRDAADPLATLNPAQWSPWIALDYPQAGRRGHVRLRLMELGDDGRSFSLYSTNVVPEQGDWIYPESLGVGLTRAVGPFFPGIGGFDTNQDWTRMGRQLGRLGEETVLDLCRDQSRWLVAAADHLSGQNDWSMLWTQTHVPDTVEHLWMVKADPIATSDPETNATYQELINRAYEIVDEFIGGMAALADDDTIVVVVSDHGFVPRLTELPLVDLFTEAGLLFWRDQEARLNADPAAETPTKDTHRAELKFWTENLDWERTVAVPLSNTDVYVNLKGREPHGLVEPGAEYEAVRTRVIDTLLDFRDPKDGRRLINMALRKEEARSFGLHGDRVGDVIFTQVAEIGNHGKQLPAGRLGLGDLQGFLCMKGPGIRSDWRMQRTAWIVDVAPTLCHLMGLPLPRDCEGSLLHQMIETED
jgi:predicted AlkP superfamily phosphohydrolase/phosphomutase